MSIKFTPLFAVASALLMLGCQSASQSEEVSENVVSPVQFNCSAPPQIENIWKLEPLLIKKGLITEEMTKEQRASIIKQYIRDKSAKYQNCRKGK